MTPKTDSEKLILLPLNGSAIATPKNDSAEVAEIFRLLPCGTVETRDYGPFLADEAAFAAIVANFEAQGNDLVVDYEHATLTGKVAPAAGWIKKLLNKGADGLWAECRWTKKAAQLIVDREYRYFSPVVMKRTADNRAVLIHSVALTNSPNMKHLKPLVNKSQVIINPETEDKTMLKKLIETLKLKAEATEADVLAAIAALKEQTPAAPETKIPDELLTTLGLKADATVSEVNGTILALKSGAQQGADLITRIADLETRLAAQAAADLVTMALKAGKITPAQKSWAEAYAQSDPQGFKAFTEAATVVVPLKTLPAGDPAASDVLTPEMQQIGSIFGNCADDLKKQL